MATKTDANYILGGPGTEELFDALKLRHQSKTVKFTLTAKPGVPHSPTKRLISRDSVIETSIESIGIEDGSGKSWLISATARFGEDRNIRYSIWFNTYSRRGMATRVSV